MESLAKNIEEATKRWWGCAILFVLPLFIFFSPFLLGWKVNVSSDGLWYFLPYLDFYQKTIAQHDSILWNPYNFAGFPVFITSGGFFSPVYNLLLRVFPLFTLHAWLIFIFFVLAGIVTMQFLRLWGLGWWSSYVGGLVYVFSQIVLGGEAVNAAFVLFLPLIFFITSRLRFGYPWWWVTVGAFITAIAWVTAPYQMMFYPLLAGFMFSIFLGRSSDLQGGDLTEFSEARKKARGVWWQLSLKYALMVAIGSIPAIVLFMPLVTFAELSWRAGGLPYGVSALDHAFVPTDLVRFFLPYFSPPLGFPFGIVAAGASLYIGILPLFFFLAAWRYSHPLARFFKWMLVGIISVAIIYSPLFWLWTKIPFLNYLRDPSRWLYIASFGTAVLSGFGLERLMREGWNSSLRRLLRVFTLASWFVAAVILFLFFALRFFSQEIITTAQRLYMRFFAPTGTTAFYEPIIGRFFEELTTVADITSPKIFIPLLFLVFSLFFIWFWERKAAYPHLFSAGAGVLTAMNLAAALWFVFETVPASVVAQQPATVNFLRDKPGRVMGFFTGAQSYAPTNTNEFLVLSSTVAPNLNLFYNLESIEYNEQLMHKNMSRLLALVGGRATTFGENLLSLPLSAGDKANLLMRRKGLLDFLGVRYIISDSQFDEKNVVKVFETNVPTTPRPVHLSIYENQEVLPLYYTIDRPIFLPSPEAVFREWEINNFRGYFVECRSQCPRYGEFSQQGTIKLVDKKNGLLALDTAFDQSAFLVFSENNLPIWKVYIDDQETSLYTVNTVFMGAVIPPGSHKVIFRYSFPF